MKKIKHFEYKKFDLHIHTFKKDNSLDNPNTISIVSNNVNDFYEKLLENKIKLIVITNHNYFNYENYQLIKNKLEIDPKEDNKIKVLPGVEMSLYYPQEENKKFHMNLILDDKYEKLDSLESKINDFYENDLKKPQNIDNLISFLSKNSIKGILILDYGKSSTKIKKKEMNNDFWFYFDFFEGNLSYESQRVNEEFKKLKKELNLSEPKVANSIFGTDNIDYSKYPNRGNRIGWTGTFFGVEASFEGLRIAIYFRHLILKMGKPNYLDYKDNKVFLPRLDSLEIKYQDEIILDRGLNVVYGKRGSGKSHFLINKIRKNLENKKTVGLKTIEQNEVTKIVEKLKTNDAKFLSFKYNETLSKTKWNKLIIKSQMSKFKNCFSNFINENNYEEIVIEISNFYKKIVNNEILNTNFEIEELLISKINIYFSEFKNEFIKIKKDLEKLISLNFNESFIEIAFKKNFNYQEFINDVFLKINSKLKKIKFNFLESNIERKTNFELENNLTLKFESLNNILDKNKLLLENIYENFKNIIYNNKSFLLTFEDIKMFSANIEFPFAFSENSLSELGKYFKIKNLDNLTKNYFWKVEKQENSFYKIEESFNIKWKYFMNDKNIDSLSPGQRVNEYINNIFLDISTRILLVDQPEDQLDAESTTNNIIEPILNRYEELIKKGVQIILVTHDPKIIINAGPINLIHTFNDNGEYKIENVSLANFIKNEKNIKIIDGKREYVHGRSELYGRNKN